MQNIFFFSKSPIPQLLKSNGPPLTYEEVISVFLIGGAFGGKETRHCFLTNAVAVAAAK